MQEKPTADITLRPSRREEKNCVQQVILGYNGYIGIMEKKMETTTTLYIGCIGIMEKKMETALV